MKFGSNFVQLQNNLKLKFLSGQYKMHYNDTVPEENAMETNEPKLTKHLSQSLVTGIANYVFEESLRNLGGAHSSSASCQSSQNFKELWKSMCKQLEREAMDVKSTPAWNPLYRIGPASVHFNRKKYVGTFDFKDNDLEIRSKDNFSTIYADTCVFKGKWQYELMLGSKGVMQVGWATINCEFSQENGVGDTPDSYAYDGNRQRKWNVATHKYGEMWHCGDIISCTIDLDEGEISYYRNGRPLGIAFDNVKTGPGIAYFPALSLAVDESLLVNFGETPFRYPQKEFQPLQAPPVEHLVIAKRCLLWVSRLVKLSTNWSEYKDLVASEEERRQSRKIALLIIAQHIGSLLAPLLSVPFIIEDALLPILKDLSDSIYDDSESTGSATSALQHAHSFFKFLMAILQEEEQKEVLNNLVMCLQRRYRQISQSINYNKQKSSLKLLHLILSEPTIRKFCLRNVLFEKESHFRFISFVCIKCIDKVRFKSFADINYWSSKNGEYSSGNKRVFCETVNAVEIAVKELEELQISVLKLLFTSDDDSSSNDNSRAIFLAKFRQFIKEQLIGSRLTVPSFIPSAVILSLFHCCFLLFLRLWNEEIEDGLGETSLPPSIFFDGNLDYFETQRLGGLESHLKKKFSIEREQALKEAKESKRLLNPMESSKHCSSAISGMDTSLPSTSGTVLGELLMTEVESVNEGLQRVNVRGIDPDMQQKKSEEELRTSLLHLLDGVILLYHHGGHKQVEKTVAQSDVFFDNVTYLEELIKKKIKYVSEQGNYSSLVLKELNRSISVLQSKLKEQSYQHAWNLATILSMENVRRIQILLKLVLGALKESSKKGGLFTFVPDFYVETLTQLCQDLRHLILCNQESGRNEPITKLKLYQPGGIELQTTIVQDYQDLLMSVGEFLALHFCDSRIIYADSKDSLIQALAGFVCHRPGLEALERMPLDSRLEMVKSLLQPYENRAWAQNNWILVRFWKGKGYGFRFTKSPHLSNKLGPKPAHCDMPNVILSSAPYFSEVFLSHVSEALQRTELSTPFLNSLLNQLNWVFSEFIGMLQEIQNASNRPERVFIDSRQLRICATCFDLALALLRVLEMIVNVAPNIFLDSNRQDSRPLLTRLCQLLCQVLNRVSICAGCFSHVVNLEIPGLETIHYFPILTAVIGIICELLKDDVYHKRGEISDHSATKILLEEASFQMNSLYPLLGGKMAFKPQMKPTTNTPSASSSSETSFEHSSELLSREEPNEANCTSIDHLFVSSKCECKYPKFCLRKYPTDILNYEIRKVIDVIHHLEAASSLKKQQSKAEDSDTLCTICYASSSDATFSPCGHSSCATCITHYLMNRTVCFFCKNAISEVKDSTGKVIYSSSSSFRDSVS